LNAFASFCPLHRRRTISARKLAPAGASLPSTGSATCRARSPQKTEVEDIPFGLRIADDCQHLTEQPPEKQALMRMMELIVKDQPLTEIAVELNRNGYRMRSGTPWTPSALFDLLPRLIEAGPKILTDQEYVSRKHHA
jgi:hypothetical protein